MQILDDIAPKRQLPKRPDVLFNIALCSILLSAGLGALMAGLNAWISPDYFRQTMGWNLEEVQPGSLIQGTLGGLAYGFVFAGFFVIVCGWATQFNCTFSFAFRQLLKVSFFIILGWAAGGFLESTFFPSEEGAAMLSSFFNTSSLELLSADWNARWVQGAIFGQKAGFLLGAVFCPLIVWRAWRKTSKPVRLK